MFHVVDSLEEHIRPISDNMRIDDRNEIWASGKKTAYPCLKRCIIIGSSKTIMMGDRPVGMFGVSPLSKLTGYGSPWLLGTDELSNHSVSFLKGCLEHFPDAINGFSYLENYVDCRNKQSIRWLKWLGFDIMNPEPYGPFNIPFHRFCMRIEDV